MTTINHTFIHFVHCKNKLRNIRVWGNAQAIEKALSDLRSAAQECRGYVRGHQLTPQQKKAMEVVI